MNLGAMVQRELRRQARQGSTYWLRVLGGALVLGGCAWGFAVTHALLRQLPGFAGLPQPTSGRGLFIGLNKWMACLVWLVGPLLTADCLSREKREGTLGLLFLTPLRPWDIVVGLTLSHALRALLVLLAGYPVLLLPVLLGGVTWADAARMFLLQVAVLGLALAAGLTASALSRRWLHTRLLALVFTLGASAAFVVVYLGVTSAGFLLGTSPAGSILSKPFLEAWGTGFRSLAGLWLSQNVAQLSNPFGFWSGGGMPGDVCGILLALAACGLSAGLVLLALWVASVGLARTWRRESAPPAPDLLSHGARLLTRGRLGHAWLERRRRRLLARNPVAWLDGGHWTTRVGRWIWAGLAGGVLLVAAVGHPDPQWASRGFELAMPPIVLAVAFCASASFQRERESGALELLLVTPLSPRDLLVGRLRGLLGTFGPALLLLSLALGVGLLGDFSTQPQHDVTGLTLGCQLIEAWATPLGVAVLGLGFGLRWPGFLAAWYRALAAWYLIPYAAGLGWMALLALMDVLLQTSHSPWMAFTGGGGSSFERQPTLLGGMVLDWWWPFMGRLTAVRCVFVVLAWRWGLRALAERRFLPRPRQLES